jgi:hypothetical protein
MKEKEKKREPKKLTGRGGRQTISEQNKQIHKRKIGGSGTIEFQS